MPATPPSANPYRNRRLADAARDGMLLTLRCNLCRRVVHFWAADLVPVLGRDHQAHVPPWPCTRCGTIEYVSLRWSIPGAADRAGLTVRRPVGQVLRWTWRDERA